MGSTNGLTPKERIIPTQLIENRMPVDRVVLVGAPTKDVDARLVEEHLSELTRLTDTAGGEVAAIVRQRIDSPNPSLFIGSGKVKELKATVESTDASLVIFDEELSPRQGSNLEKEVGVRIMDRPELILDIFATRARTREAKLQVELAQLEYLLPRLKRMWNHLSRIRGGIGLRGPGETQLETDRRLIGLRITELKKKLEVMERSRATQRKARAGQFRAALVGYTNAGKSSLLRALSGADLFVEDRLFATLDSATRTVDLGSGFEALVTDTVGFIRKLPHHLIASFRSTLEEAREADLLLHVIDASHSDREEQRAVVLEVLEDLGLGDRPRLLVFNKIDRITHAEEEVLRQRTRAFNASPAVFVSALDQGVTDELRSALLTRMRHRLRQVRVDLHVADGETLASLYREGEVLDRKDDGTTVHLTVRIPSSLVGRLEQRQGVTVGDDA